MAYKNYVPVKCSGKECAYPLATCDSCGCNVSLYGKNALKAKDPKGNYRFSRLIFTKHHK